MMKRITILGSINVDVILEISRLPKPGETMPMKSLSTAGGGKGANQAIAAVRSGAATTFIGKVGDDAYGEKMLTILKENNIDTSSVIIKKGGQTGQAYILLQESGQNSIIINGGTNREITADDVIKAQNSIKNADFLIAQFEVDIERILEAFIIAHKNKVVTILNPAPAKDITDDLLKITDLIVPNEIEAQMMTGIEITDENTAAEAAKILRERGVKNVIITLGSQGAYYLTENEDGLIPALKVNAIDTTAAGDTFIGALCSQLGNNLANIKEAIKYATKASSITVQTLGAIPSIPTIKQVNG
ncbi:ribokinase [Liquorilactobacillus mali]|uniref:ribokinase n=1 Tax=Liquorilactobacillus mali TaxID=1618 RepID=UPI002350056C|nr:ribokinase [Liquorilactobacillus mali]MDC7953986.1 ribokinase [Liquorilactobacillus mali]